MRLVSFGRPVLDVAVKLQSFEGWVSIGGVETNVAINWAVLGGESVLIGAIGADFLWRELKKLAQDVKKFRPSLQEIKEKRSGMIILLIRENKVYRKFVEYGASECFRISPLAEVQIAQGKIFFTSLFSANTAVLLPEWEKMLRFAKNSSLKIAVSLAGIETVETNKLSFLLGFIKDVADFVFANRKEVEKIDPTIFTSQLVIITNESKPAIARFGNREWLVFPKRIQDVYPPYTIGAGDAFTAAFLMNYLREGDIKEAIRYGHQIAALKLNLPLSHLTPEALGGGDKL